jgi:hypothetical protein
MKRIKATFTGKNSLGYVNGKEYELIIRNFGSTISRIDGTGKCPYDSLSAFFKNWNNITVIDK